MFINIILSQCLRHLKDSKNKFTYLRSVHLQFTEFSSWFVAPCNV